jgi:hypothetical protein
MNGHVSILLLPGFQKGRDVKDCKEKGKEQFWHFALYQKMREKTDRISLILGSMKCFSVSFKTL